MSLVTTTKPLESTTPPAKDQATAPAVLITAALTGSGFGFCSGRSAHRCVGQM
jgi:hypothetical protein